MTAETIEPRILVCGEDAVVVEFGDRIDPAINDRVYALADAIETAAHDAVVEMVPTYRSLLVQYDVERSTLADVSNFVSELSAQIADSGAKRTGGGIRRVYELPVNYGGEAGEDLVDVAEHAGMTPDEVIAVHSGTDYRVYMLGFAPGFPYLGGMDERIATPRLTTPRVRVPAGSVGIAESQTGVYPQASPGGWRLIGNTPVSLFDPSSDPPVPFLPGSFIRFVPVTPEEAARVAARVAEGTYTVTMNEEPA